MLESPPQKRRQRWTNLTRPRQRMISRRTSTYLPEEGRRMPKVAVEIRAGGRATSQPRVGRRAAGLCRCSRWRHRDDTW